LLIILFYSFARVELRHVLVHAHRKLWTHDAVVSQLTMKMPECQINVWFSSYLTEDDIEEVSKVKRINNIEQN
jgi:hypothetical protein